MGVARRRNNGKCAQGAGERLGRERVFAIAKANVSLKTKKKKEKQTKSGIRNLINFTEFLNGSASYVDMKRAFLIKYCNCTDLKVL